MIMLYWHGGLVRCSPFETENSEIGGIVVRLEMGGR